jgi:hypothetical protein
MRGKIKSGTGRKIVALSAKNTDLDFELMAGIAHCYI